MKYINKYSKLTGDKLEEHLSNFLKNSWSYSSVQAFINNPKAFEKDYIYNLFSKRSATSVSGNAYHEAARFYYEALRDGVVVDLVDLERVAFDYINDFDPGQWKIQKTNPTIEDCEKAAIKNVSVGLNNFFAEKSIYDDYISEILGVEQLIEEWINVNGVDIPLPCRGKLDLIIKTKEGKTVIVDHKLKKSFTDENKAKYELGQQAIVYVLLYEKKYNIKVDEIWLVENKTSKNKNGENQLNKIVVDLSENNRRIYEYLLYEGLRNMLMAIQDPDYIYPINYRDNLNDFNDLIEFAANNMLSEVELVNVEESKRGLIEKRRDKINSSFESIKLDAVKVMKNHAKEFTQNNLSLKDMDIGQKIEHTFKTLGVITKVAHVIEGYSSDTFLIEVNAGVKISSLFKYRLDIARALSVCNIRMMSDLIVFENKSYFAIEAIRTESKFLMFDKSESNGAKIPLGKSNFGETIYWDFENHSTPHALVCGASGSGKTQFLISTLEYVLLSNQADRIVIFDRKNEFTNYHSNHKISIYKDISEIEASAELEVENMQSLIDNRKKERVFIIFDEFSQAFMDASKGNDLKIHEEQIVGLFANGNPKTKLVHTGTKKSLEENIKMIAQLGRSSGYRMISATQRASAKVISGDTKVNFPVLVCFKVPKETDSKVVIDESGAETLRGYGDGLINSPQYQNTIRFQGFYKEN